MFSVSSVVKSFRSMFSPRTIVQRIGRPIGGGDMGYEAGRQNRLDLEFAPAATGPNLLADETLDLARRRSRWLVDNDSLISGAKQTFVANVVPSVIYPQPSTKWKEVNERIGELFWRIAEGVDVARSRTLLEDQRLFLGEIFTVGDILPHFPIAPAWNGFSEGPAVELIDSDRLDDVPGAFGNVAVGGGGTGQNRTRQGVEFDALGRPVAYHVLETHPADGAWNIGKTRSKRIPATDANLAFRPRRPGQVRGVPHLHAVMRTQRMVGGYKEAGLAQARAAAIIGAYFTGVSPGGIAGNVQGGVTDAQGNAVEALEPGMIGYLPQGASVEIKGGTLPGPTFDSTVKTFNREVAKGSGLSYSEFTGDYSEATFSSERASQLLTRRLVRPEQEFLWHKHTRPLYRRLIAWWIASGELELPAEARAAWIADPEQLYAALVVYPGFEWVNPQQEAQAAAIELEMGTNSAPDICAARGQHWQDVVDRQLDFEEYENAERKKRGLEPRAKKQSETAGAVKPGEDKPVEEKKPRLVKTG